MGIPDDIGPLAGFLADGQETHRRARASQGDTRVGGAHDRELDQMLGAAVDVRARVDEHGRPGFGGDEDGERGAIDARGPAEGVRGNERRARMAGADDRLRAPSRDVLAGDDDRRAGLATQRRERRLVHADDVRGGLDDDREAGRALVRGERHFDGDEVADEPHVDVTLTRREDRAGDDRRPARGRRPWRRAQIVTHARACATPR